MMARSKKRPVAASAAAVATCVPFAALGGLLLGGLLLGGLLLGGLLLGGLLLGEMWNYGLFGLQGTLLGFLGIVVFLAPLTALISALSKRERTSAPLLVAYCLWVPYDLAWAFELWRMNAF